MTKLVSTLAAFALGFALTACGDGSTSDGGSGSEPVAPPATIPVDAPEPDDCGLDATGSNTIQCEGLSVELTVPDACARTACGLIVDVHGFGMNGSAQDLHTELSEIGTRSGFVVLQPSAPVDPNSGFASWSGSNDSQVLGIINRLRRTWHLMDERIHMTGYSQGGFMTWRFLCTNPELFGSVAPLSAGSGTCFDQSVPAEQVDILYGHGTTDGLVDFAGATRTIELIVDKWDMTDSETVSRDAGHDWTRYTNDQGTRFEFIQYEWETDFVLGSSALLGHCFPGSDQFVGCGRDNAFHWGEEITKFFLDHPRR